MPEKLPYIGEIAKDLGISKIVSCGKPTRDGGRRWTRLNGSVWQCVGRPLVRDADDTMDGTGKLAAVYAWDLWIRRKR